MNISNEHLNHSFPEVLVNRNDVILLYMGEPSVERIGIGSARETQPMRDRREYILRVVCVASCIAALHHGFADLVLFLFIPLTYSHPGLAVATIEYQLLTFTISQVFRWVCGGSCRQRGRRQGVSKSSPRHSMAVL